MFWLFSIPAAVVIAYIVYTMYLATVLKWEDEQTVGLAYYGLPLAGRNAFKERLRAHARRLRPLIQFNAKYTKLDFARSHITYKGVAGPTGSCSVDSFAKAAAYTPRADQITLMWNISHADAVSEREYNSYDHVFVASAPNGLLRRAIDAPMDPIEEAVHPRLCEAPSHAPRRRLVDEVRLYVHPVVIGAGRRPFGEGLALRGTFVIDPSGKIKIIEVHDNGIGRDAKELLRKVQAAIYVANHPGEVCPAKWTPGAESLTPSLDLVGKI